MRKCLVFISTWALFASFLITISPSQAAATTTLTTCISLKSATQYLAKDGKCNERIYESATWYQHGAVPHGTPGSKVISINTCQSRTRLDLILLRNKCNPKTQITSTWHRPLGPPAAPSIVTITAGLLGTATVATKAPTDNGGSHITTYSLAATPTGVEGKTERASSTFNSKSSGEIKISGLTPGVTYTFTLIAHNSLGASASSQASAPFLAPTVPAAPAITAAVTTGTNSALVTYTAPTFNGGSPITSYTATSIPGGIQVTAFRSTSGTIDVTGLLSSTSYTFTVVANNFAGSSKPSTASASITTLTPPPPPPEPVPSVEAPAPTPTLAAPAFTLSASSETRTVSTAATGFTITSTGGTIASFAINATPAGMSFSTSSGALTGTPTSVATATTYTVTATNATGSAAATFALTVIAKLLPTFSAWANLSKPALGHDFVLSAPVVTGSLAGTIAYSSASTGVITISGSTAHVVGTGTSVITATFTPTNTAAYSSATTTMTITVTAGDYTVGMDGPGGGKVFYVSTSTFLCGPTQTTYCKFLESAGTTGSGAWTDNFYAWSGNTVDWIGTTSTTIGSGYKNTLAMITQNNTSEKAGTIAQAFRGGGLSDWYLPSTDELNQMCKWAFANPWTSDATPCSGGTLNLGTGAGLGAAGFKDYYYWSSSELPELPELLPKSAQDQDFYYVKGLKDYGWKNGASLVRPVRAFASNLPSFTLSSSSETRMVNTVANGFTINSTGGNTTSFGISATPAGMSFNTSTGALTGTPTSVAAATAYTVTATNATGSATRTFTLTVEAALAAPAFTLSSSSETRTVNIAATGFTISSTGGLIASFAINATPAGMSFSTSTGALTGTPTSVATATAYTITATNATGSATQTFTLTVEVAPALPAFTLSSSSETRAVNSASTGFTVTSTGGTIASFAINPAPAGLTFNTENGRLNGWTGTVAGITTFTVTATNTSGTATQTFVLTVTPGAVKYVAISRASVGTSKGSTFTVQPQITIQDFYLNTVITSTAVVTATISAGGTLLGTATATAIAGVATFVNLGISGTVGTNYAVTYTYTPDGTIFFRASTTLTSYALGSTGPGGGKIFYISAAPFSCGPTLNAWCSYLEAATSAASPAWTDATYAWSGTTNTSIGTTATGIGTGYKNTLAMISQSSTALKAGTIARAYTGGGLTDWYLPSKDDLNELYSSRASIGGFLGTYYWSSSESSTGNAWLQDWSSFNQSASSKSGSNHVRPIRSF